MLVLCNEHDAPGVIVCAVPTFATGISAWRKRVSVEDKAETIEGIRTHYASSRHWLIGVKNSGNIPIVGTGICSPLADKPSMVMACANSMSAPGSREAGIFPACFNYLALGHLHVPKSEWLEIIRYSGLLCPQVRRQNNEERCQVEFHSTAASVQLIDVPVQKARARQGDWGRHLKPHH